MTIYTQISLDELAHATAHRAVERHDPVLFLDPGTVRWLVEINDGRTSWLVVTFRARPRGTKQAQTRYTTYTKRVSL